MTARRVRRLRLPPAIMRLGVRQLGRRCLDPALPWPVQRTRLDQLTRPALLPRGMRVYGQICAWSLARAHARSGDRIAIAAYLGGSDVFDQAITRFAAAYADQNERDHKSLTDAVASGRITAEPDM